MKKSLKMIGIALVFMSIMFCLQNIVLADTPQALLKVADTWTENGNSGISSSTQRVVGTAINVIRIVGTGIAIIMITYVAIKYMSAAPSEKAEFKKSATAMIVGAIVLFAATNILTIIANFASTNISG